MSKNLETLKEAHKAFNRHDIEKGVGFLAEGGVYHDVARGISYRGRSEFRKFLSDWTTALSDCELYEPTYIDVGDTVVAQFTGRGTNDGPLGSLPPTGKKVSLSFCEIVGFNKDGRITMGRVYYDRLSLLEQLGHMKSPTAPPVAAR